MPREPLCVCGYTVQWSIGGLWRRIMRMVSLIIAYALLIPRLCYMIVDVVPKRIEVQPPSASACGTTCVVWRYNNEPSLQRAPHVSCR